MFRITAALFAIILCAHNVHAQEEICPAVYPCLENGEFNPLLDDSGYCAQKFKSFCAKVVASQLSDELLACQQENLSIKSNGSKLTKEIRALRKKLSKSRKSK